jgi:hypothetical protein
MRRTAKVVNTSRRVVLDGRGLVTLSGGRKRRILYQNTCDQRQTRTTSHCDDQATPRLVVQRLTFADGDATGATYDGGGGGAIFARGGRLKIVNSRFVRNRCDPTGPDLGGGAVRALSQHDGKPVTVVGSTFTRGVCSNGAALSSIGVSWSIYDSVFTANRAIGRGANPAREGTPGGGSGGAVYADGNDFRVLLAGTRMRRNHAREGGGAVFFVSNDRSGVLEIWSSTLRDNPSDGFETDPGIFFLGRNQVIVDSVVSARTSARAAPADGVACMRVVNPYPGTRYEGIDLTRIRGLHIRCSTARRVARRAHRKALGVTPSVNGVRHLRWNGWRVRGDLRGDHDRYVARKGAKRVRWRF